MGTILGKRKSSEVVGKDGGSDHPLKCADESDDTKSPGSLWPYILGSVGPCEELGSEPVVASPCPTVVVRVYAVTGKYAIDQTRA